MSRFFWERFRNKKLPGVALLVGLLCAVGSSISAVAQSPIVKLGATLSAEHPTNQALAYFQEQCAALTMDQIRIHLFPDEQLGTRHDLLAGLQFGNIELGVLPAEVLADLLPNLTAVAMPFLWRDDEHRFKVLDGPTGRRLLDELARHNLIGLSFFDAGTRNLITAERHLTGPEDLQTFRLGCLAECADHDCRKPFQDLAGLTFASLGAALILLSSDPIDPTDFHNLSGQNAVTAWEGTAVEFLRLNLRTLGAAYFTESRHLAIPDILVASETWFESLPADAQALLYKAARLTALRQRELYAAMVQNSQTHLEQTGVQFKDVDRDAWFAAVQPVYTQMIEQLGPEFEELLATIRAVK